MTSKGSLWIFSPIFRTEGAVVVIETKSKPKHHYIN